MHSTDHEVTSTLPTVKHRLIATAAGLLALAACTSSGDEPATPATSTSAAPTTTVAAPTTVAPSTTASPTRAQRFDGRGGYDVGVTTLKVGARISYVYYPVDKGTAGSAAKWKYSSLDAYDENLRPLIPKVLVSDFEFDAFVDAQPSPKGPFPVVLSSHGAGSFPTDLSHSHVHMASWGFVVIAPDHLERDRMSQVGRSLPANPGQDVRDLFEALDATGKLDRFAKVLDTKKLAVFGLSAGGRTAVEAATDPRITTIIVEAPAVSNPGDTGTPSADPKKPVLILQGDGDTIVPLSRVSAYYQRIGPPKRMVVFKKAGHNTFTDACPPIRDRSGLAQYAKELGLSESLLRAGENGCLADFVDPKTVWPLVYQLTVGWLHQHLLGVGGASIEPAYLAANFASIAIEDRVAS